MIAAQGDYELMRFTLRYSGDDLKSSGNSGGKSREKHVLRSHFHSQLQRVWDRHTTLAAINRRNLFEPVKKRDRWEAATPDRQYLTSLMFQRKVGGTWFVPLITPNMEVHCHLSLRFGRPVKFGTIFTGGDLDGRLKTLFDALAVPKDETHIPVEMRPGGEYLCLLSDDDLITGLSIDSYELLDPVCTEGWVDIDLAITITAITPMPGTSVLIFGG